MAAISFISPDLTVRQVATTYPACAELLHRWPGARKESGWSLQQLGPFARDCGVDEARFLQELAGVADVPVRSHAATKPSHSPMPLVFTAMIVGLSLGTAWGVGLLLRIAVGASHEIVPARSVHVHGLAQLWGWLALFVFGVGSHLLRQNTKHPAPRWLDGIGGAAVVVALLLFISTMLPAFRASFPHAQLVASALLLLGASCFSISVLWSLIGRGLRPQFWHGFVIAMIAWLMIWAVTDLSLRTRAAGESQLTDVARGLLIVLPVLGFATNAIYGFGIRLIPGLLNIGSLRPRCFAATLMMHNLGFCLLLLLPIRSANIAGAMLMLAAAITYIAGMNGLRSKPSRPIYGVDPRGHVLIRVAFFWLLAGLTMVVIQQIAPVEFPHAYNSAWRHGLTVGFITTMILGVGHRVLPVFIRQPLASTQLMLVSAALIILGNAGRVGLELLTMGGWIWSFRVMGITGVLELTALILFAINITTTARNRRRVYSADVAMTPNTRVQDAVNVRPEFQSRFVELGITMFDGAAFIAPSMTLGALALASGMKPNQLVTALDATSRDVGIDVARESVSNGHHANTARTIHVAR